MCENWNEIYIPFRIDSTKGEVRETSDHNMYVTYNREQSEAPDSAVSWTMLWTTDKLMYGSREGNTTRTMTAQTDSKMIDEP